MKKTDTQGRSATKTGKRTIRQLYEDAEKRKQKRGTTTTRKHTHYIPLDGKGHPGEEEFRQMYEDIERREKEEIEVRLQGDAQQKYGAKIRMTKGELINKLADRMPGIRKKDAAVIVDIIFDSMKKSLAEGGRVEISGVGSLLLHKKTRPLATIKP